MEPITIAAIVGYLAKTLKDNKTFKDFTTDFTDATVRWIRPLFLKDEENPKEVLENLAANPDSKSGQKMAEAVLELAVEKNPDAKEHLQEIYDFIKAKESKGESIRIENSKNVVMGNINTGGGNSIVGDGSSINNNTNNSYNNNNTYYHTGSGDIVGRDKTVNYNGGNGPDKRD